MNHRNIRECGFRTGEEAKQRMLGLGRLCVRILDRMRQSMSIDGLPLACFDLNASPLDLQDKDSMQAVRNDEICLAIALTPATQGLPPD